MRNWLRRILPDPAVIGENRWLAPFRNRLLHPRLWHLNRRSAAGGVAAGLFCGLIPGPFQMLGAAICAMVFRINLPLALLTTLYTNPFTIVPLYVLAYWLGSGIVGGKGDFIPPPETDLFEVSAWLAWLAQLGWPLMIGLILLAGLSACTGYAIVRIVWRARLVRARSRRLSRRKQPVAQR